MGKTLSVLKRPVMNYNIENRAHKEMERQASKIGVAAPRHPSTAHLVQQESEANAEKFKKAMEINPGLDEMLKQVHVSSTGTNVEINRKEIVFDVDDTVPEEEDDNLNYGYPVPVVIPKGRLSLRQAINMFIDSKADKEKWTHEKLAEEYNLELKDVSIVMQYFGVLQMRAPKKKTVSTPDVEKITESEFVESQKKIDFGKENDPAVNKN